MRDSVKTRARIVPWLFVAACLAGMTVAVIDAAEPEPVTLDNVVTPGENSPDEPLAAAYSRERAAHFLDSASLGWQKDRNCMTCHTNYLYLMARPKLGLDAAALSTVRDYAERLVTERWEDKGPRWDAEVVMTGAVLAFHDAQTSGRLHPTTRTALDRMWTVQRDDGGFDWLKCDWPPMEDDDYFGATMAALGAGVAPEEYAATPAAQGGLAKLAAYFRANPPPSLHHRAMLLWASLYLDDLMTDDERRACVDALLALQHDDGGWGLATLGDWQRGDDKEQDLVSSDGYGTGFVVFIARKASIPVDDPRLVRGVEWLRSHQRESGRWFTRSLYKDNKHFLTHAGTAYAVLALDACGALDDSPPVD